MSDHKEERVLHEGWQVCGRQGGTAAMCGSCGDGQFGGEAAVVLEGKGSLFARRGFNIRVSLRAIPGTCAPRGVLKRWLWVSSSGPHAFLRKCCALTHSPPSAMLANSESHSQTARSPEEKRVFPLLQLFTKLRSREARVWCLKGCGRYQTVQWTNTRFPFLISDTLTVLVGSPDLVGSCGVVWWFSNWPKKSLRLKESHFHAIRDKNWARFAGMGVGEGS